MIRDGPSKRDELASETRELKQSLVQSLEVQQRTSLTSRFQQEERREISRARMLSTNVRVEPVEYILFMNVIGGDVGMLP